MKAYYLVFLMVTCVSAYAVDEMELDDSETFDYDIDTALIDNENNTELAVGTDGAEDEPDVGIWYGKDKIAFSVYLSKDKYFGKDQHIKYDKILLNDGDSYEHTTGVFRAKVDGVYMFTYSIGQRHHNEFRAKLMYDGKVINGAIAEGVHRYQDVQGSNTAIIHVCKGKSVWVAAANRGRVEGSNCDNRYTTFSGFLLYARR